MKRLTDERVAELQEDEGAGRIDNPEYKTAGDLDALFRDHLQAREDRKRYGALLRMAVALLDGKVEPSVTPVNAVARMEIEDFAGRARTALHEIGIP